MVLLVARAARSEQPGVELALGQRGTQDRGIGEEVDPPSGDDAPRSGLQCARRRERDVEGVQDVLVAPSPGVDDIERHLGAGGDDLAGQLDGFVGRLGRVDRVVVGVAVEDVDELVEVVTADQNDVRARIDHPTIQPGQAVRTYL